ncbi:hypothetical protein [Streptomyces cyaneus]|uniref:hypothetical protein n=1 Tax=Streptomyces cyaneus TaxID=1904 RepID=UPI000FF89CCA|nr:hypothetical protein [Streptomyces cyaneus]
MPSRLPQAALAALAGPLLVGGAAKLLTPASRLAWPYRKGPLRAPLGPRLAGGAELAAAASLVLLPGRAAPAAAVVTYGTLTAVAQSLDGQRCACFGAARLATVGRAHIGANALGSAVAATLLACELPARPRLRGATAALAATVTAAAVLFADRQRAQGAADAVERCEQAVAAVRLYVSDNCPACRALKQLLGAMEPVRQDRVTLTVVGSGSELPPEMADMSVPCALPVDAAGGPVCSPVSGIGAVKALIDTVVIAGADAPHAA